MGADERESLLARLAPGARARRAAGPRTDAADRVPARPREMPDDLASMKPQVYKDPRPKEYFDRFHERSRTREPDWVYEAVRVLTSLYALDVLPRARRSPPRTCRTAR